MKKTTLLCMLLFFSVFSYSQVLNQPANWPNTNWSITGTYNAPGLESDPTISSNFAFNDDVAGSTSVDNIAAESPVIDISAAFAAGETWLFVTVDYTYRLLADNLSIEYWDADANTWVAWQQFVASTDQPFADFCLGSRDVFISDPLDTSGFTATQQTGFRYRIAYDDLADWRWGFCFDSPTITSTIPPTCFDISNLAVANVGATTVDVSWTANSGETVWEVAIQPAGTGFPSGAGTSVTTNAPYMATGLSGATNYEVYVRADCGAVDGFSNWVGPITFITENEPPPIPVGVACAMGTSSIIFTEDFETDPPFGWTGNTFDGGNGNWDITPGGANSNGTGPSVSFSGANHLEYEASGNSTTIASAISPAIDLTSATDGAELSFYMHAFGADMGILNVNIGNSPTGPFTTVYTYIGELQTSDTDAWIPAGVDLTAYLGQIIYIEFSYGGAGTGFEGDMSIDFVRVEACGDLCIAPSAVVATNITETSADISWTANSGETAWEIAVQPAGTGEPTGAGTAITTNPYTATGLMPSTAYEIYIRADCGGGLFSAWTGPFDFNTSLAAPVGVTCATGTSSIIFTEDFEDDPPVGWTGNSFNGTNGNWDITPGGANSDGTGPSVSFSGANHLEYEASGNSTTIASAISPAIDLTTATDGAELSFYLHAFGADMGTLNVNVGNSPTGPFTNIFSYSGQLQTTDTDAWIPTGIDLSVYLGQVIYIEFSYGGAGTGFEGDMSIDFVRVEACGSFCSTPTALASANVTDTTADISWTANNGETAWEIVVQPVGTGAPTGLGTPITTNPYTATGLNPSTDNEVYIRANCGAGEFSLWTGPITFTTENSPPPPPMGVTCTTGNSIIIFTEDFETNPPNGWTGNSFDGTNGNWDITPGGANSNGTGPSASFSGGNHLEYEASGDSSTIASAITPAIDLSTAADAVELSFYFHAFGDDIGTLNVNVGNSPTGPFTTEYTWGGSLQTIDTDAWTPIGVDLSAYIGQTIYIEFSYGGAGTGFEGDMSIDLVQVEACGSFCIAPDNLAVNNFTDTTVDISWNTITGETAWEIVVQPPGTGIPTGSGTPITTNPYTVTGLTPNTSYEVYIRADCGAGQFSLWGTPITFTTVNSPPPPPVGVTCATGTSTIIFLEDFEDGPPSGWTGTNFDGSTGNWDITPGNSNSIGTGPFASFSGGNHMEYQAPSTAISRAVTPAIDLSSATDGAELSFYLHSFGDDIGTFNINVSNVITGPYTNIFTYTGALQGTDTDAWVPVGVDLSAYIGQTIYIDFSYLSLSTGDEGDLSIDLVQVEACGSFCVAPTELASANVTDTTADISWTALNGETAWEIVVQPAGTGVPTGSGTPITTNPYTVTGLLPTTAYEVYVRTDCGVDGFSDWTNPIIFTTENAPPPPITGVTCASGTSTIIFSEDFETNSPPGWTGTNFDGTDGNWDITAGNANSTGTGPFASFSGGNHMEYEASGSTSTLASAITPAIDLSTATDAVELSFYFHAFGDDIGTLNVNVGTSPTGPFATEYAWAGSLQTADTDPWTPIGIDLSAYIGQTIYIEFSYLGAVTGIEGDMAIDLVQVEACGSFCLLPNALAASNITDTTADISWNANNGETAWEIVVQPLGTGIPTGSGTPITTNPYTATGLTPNTDYEVYLRANCGVDGFSNWTDPITFTTRNSPPPPPVGVTCSSGNSTIVLTEDFEVNPPAGWTLTGFNGNSGNWNITVGNTNSLGTGPFASFSGARHLEYVTLGNPIAIASAVSPAIDLTAATDAAELSFYLHAFGDDIGTLNVNVGNSPTGPFTTAYTWSGDLQTADTDPWVPAGVDLSAYLGQVIYIEFSYGGPGTGPQGEIAIDFVQVEACGSFCLTPNNLNVTTITNNSAVFDWTAINGETAWEIVVQPLGTGAPTVSGTPITTNPYTATGLAPNLAYEVYIRADCGAGQYSLWSDPITFTTESITPLPPNGVTCTSGTSTIVLTEDFENGPPSGWTGTGFDGSDGNWDITPGGANSLDTGPSVSFSGGNHLEYEASGNSTTIASAITPAIDLTTATDGVELSFYLHAFGADMGTLNVNIGNSSTGPFVNVFSYSGQLQTAETDAWIPVGVDLSAYIGQTIYIEFSYGGAGTGFEGDMSIDFVQVEACGSFCIAPTTVTTTNITDTTADIGWTAINGETAWEIVVQPAGTGVPTGSGTPITANPYTATGLMATTTYEVYIRTNCGLDGFSNWTNPITFTTTIPPPSPPVGVTCSSGASTIIFTEDFENDPPLGWTGTGFDGTNGNWDITPGNANSTGTGPFASFSGGNHLEYEASGSSNGVVASAITPAIDLTAAIDGAELSFYLHAYGSETGTLNVNVGNSPTGPFTTAYTWSGEFQTADTDPWVPVGVDLSAYLGQVIYIEFSYSYIGVGFEVADIAIDLVQVEACGSFCLDPDSLTVTDVTSNSAVVGWNAVNGETAWEYVVQPVGTGVPTGAGTPTTSNPVTITGLTPDTDYEVYVRSNCGVDGFSIWSLPTNFKTNIAIDCSATPINQTYCYNNNDNSAFTYSSSDGVTPLFVVFNAGQIQALFDRLIVTDTDGSILFNGDNGGDLTGLTFQSTGPSITISVDATNNTSCQTAFGYIPWDYTITCVNTSDPFAPAGVNCGTDAPTILLSETFVGILPVGWTGTNFLGAEGDWGITAGNANTASGPFASYFGGTHLEYNTGNNSSATASVVTRAINLNAAINTAELSFFLYAYGADIGTLNVGIANSPLGPFTNVFTSSGAYQMSDTEPWRQIGVNLDAYLGQTIYVQFSYSGTGTGPDADVAIDLVQVKSCGVPLDVPENDFESFTYYPNPVKNNVLYLQAEKPIDKVTVVNMLGQSVLSIQPKTQNHTLQMQNLRAGMYLVNVEIGGATKTLKILKE